MPGRAIPLVNNQIYHVFNRGINRQPTFTDKKEYQRAVESIKFYRFAKPPTNLSKFLRLEDKKQKEFLESLKKLNLLVEIICYCLMPNHFHFLLRQSQENGIAKFLSNFQNSYTRYFNTKNNREGNLFLDQFKAIRIETDEQLVHVSRYIHLNPHTGYVVKSFTELEKYPWSSFSDYLQKNSQLAQTNLVLDFFIKNNYREFILDQADYQRSLKLIEHSIFE